MMSGVYRPGGEQEGGTLGPWARASEEGGAFGLGTSRAEREVRLLRAGRKRAGRRRDRRDRRKRMQAGGRPR